MIFHTQKSISGTTNLNINELIFSIINGNCLFCIDLPWSASSKYHSAPWRMPMPRETVGPCTTHSPNSPFDTQSPSPRPPQTTDTAGRAPLPLWAASYRPKSRHKPAPFPIANSLKNAPEVPVNIRKWASLDRELVSGRLRLTAGGCNRDCILGSASRHWWGKTSPPWLVEWRVLHWKHFGILKRTFRWSVPVSRPRCCRSPSPCGKLSCLDPWWRVWQRTFWGWTGRCGVGECREVRRVWRIGRWRCQWRGVWFLRRAGSGGSGARKCAGTLESRSCGWERRRWSGPRPWPDRWSSCNVWRVGNRFRPEWRRVLKKNRKKNFLHNVAYWLLKKGNYSRFRQFSERFFEKSIIRMENHESRVKDVISTNTSVIKNRKKNWSRTISELQEGLQFVMRFEIRRCRFNIVILDLFDAVV